MYVESDEYPGVRQPFNDNAAYGPADVLPGHRQFVEHLLLLARRRLLRKATRPSSRASASTAWRSTRARYGYGSRTGLDISGEQDGTIPDPTWKQFHKGQPWFKGDTYNMSIGQGDVLATPLQVANTTNVIANGGTMYQPHLAREELDSDGNVVKDFSDPPESDRARSIPPTWRSCARRWSGASRDRGSSGSRSLACASAGKTGTAEYQGPPDEHGNLPTHGWFTGFAPADNPEITVTVFVENGSGTNDASPIGARIIRRYFHQPDVPPDAPKLPPAPQPARAAAATRPASPELAAIRTSRCRGRGARR